MKTLKTRIVCILCIIMLFMLMSRSHYDTTAAQAGALSFPVDKRVAHRTEVYKAKRIKQHRNLTFHEPHIVEAHRPRFIHAQEACMSLNRPQPPHIRTLFHPMYTAGYCRVNKCASVFLIELMKYGTNCDMYCLRNATKKMAIAEKEYLMNNTFTFMFVRNPYNRLFAYYCNRFFAATDRWARDDFGKKCIRRFREKPTQLSLEHSHDLTFSEFLKCVVYEFQTTGAIKDEHIRPMFIGCDPCNHNFSFIGKLETLAEDFKYLIEGLKKSSVMKSDLDRDLLSAEISQRLQERPFIALNRSIIYTKDLPIPQYHLYSRTWSYFQILGKISTQYSLPFSREEANITPIEVLKDVLYDYVKRSKTDSDVSLHKLESMAQAYSSVPVDIRRRLRTILQADCDVFDYDCSPDFVFRPDRVVNTTFDYFKPLNLQKY